MTPIDRSPSRDLLNTRQKGRGDATPSQIVDAGARLHLEIALKRERGNLGAVWSLRACVTRAFRHDHSARFVAVSHRGTTATTVVAMVCTPLVAQWRYATPTTTKRSRDATERIRHAGCETGESLPTGHTRCLMNYFCVFSADSLIDFGLWLIFSSSSTYSFYNMISVWYMEFLIKYKIQRIKLKRKWEAI